MITAPPDDIRIILAVAHFLTRMRLQASCDRHPYLHIVAEAPSPLDLPMLTDSLQPDAIICDETTLTSPAMTPYARHHGRNDPLIVALPTLATHQVSTGTLPIAATILPSIAASELYTVLHQALALHRNPPPPEAVERPNLAHRFTMPGTPGVTHLLPTTAALAAPYTTILPATAHERRRHPLSQIRLEAAIDHLRTALTTEHDLLTGLPNGRVLDDALDLLTTLPTPAAFLFVRLWYAPDAWPDAYPPMLRAAGGTLRTTFRQPDLLCKLPHPIFAALLPGVSDTTAPIVRTRLQGALLRLRRQYTDHTATLRAAIGIACWNDQGPVPRALQTAWEDLLAACNTEAGH